MVAVKMCLVLVFTVSHKSVLLEGVNSKSGWRTFLSTKISFTTHRSCCWPLKLYTQRELSCTATTSPS